MLGVSGILRGLGRVRGVLGMTTLPRWTLRRRMILSLIVMALRIVLRCRWTPRDILWVGLPFRGLSSGKRLSIRLIGRGVIRFVLRTVVTLPSSGVSRTCRWRTPLVGWFTLLMTVRFMLLSFIVFLVGRSVCLRVGRLLCLSSRL